MADTTMTIVRPMFKLLTFSVAAPPLLPLPLPELVLLDAVSWMPDGI